MTDTKIESSGSNNIIPLSWADSVNVRIDISFSQCDWVIR